jgi:hypothetical protein
VRPSAAVLLAALLLAGCGRHERALSAGDRQACERFAARADHPGSPAYESVLAECVHNTLHPERGGG